MNKLTAYQIADAFPDECMEFVPRVLVALNSRLVPYDEHLHKLSKMNLTSEQFNLALILTDDMKPKKELERIKLYTQVMQILKGTKEPLDVMKAREYPIESLITTHKKTLGDKIICSCPLHEDNTPSCYIYNKTNSFYCFSCNKGGDVISFYMELNKVNFLTAVKGLL